MTALTAASIIFLVWVVATVFALAFAALFGKVEP